MTAKQRHISPDQKNQSLPRPMVNLSLAFITGVIYSKYFPVSYPYVLVVFLLIVMAWFAWVKEYSATSKSNTYWVLLLLLTGLVGAVRMESQLLTWRSAADEMEQAARMGVQNIQGTVIDIQSSNGGNGYAVLGNISAEKWLRSKLLPGKLRLHAPDSVIHTLQLNQNISFDAQIIPVRGPSLPGSFDYQEFLALQDIFAKAYISTSIPIQIDDTQSYRSPLWIRGLAIECVERIQQTLQNAQPNAETITSLIASICFGVRGNMPAALNNQLQESGLAHITSISGLHVTMVLVLIFWGLNTCLVKRHTAAWITIAVSVLYLCLVGFRVPAIRAVLMAFVALGKHIVQRKADPLNSLGLAALIVLMMNPSELFMASFQLSFMATLTLLLLIPYDEWLQRKIQSAPVLWLVRALVSSVAVVIGLSPFTVYYFNMISWGSILGNLAAVPLVTLLLPLTYLWTVLLFSPLKWMSNILGYTVSSLCEGLAAVTAFFSHPLFWFVVPGWSVYYATILILCLLFIIKPRVVFFEYRFIKLYSYQVLMLLLMVYGIGVVAAKSYQPLRVDFLALGQGDCIFIQTPDGKTTLIDGGSPQYKKSNYRFSRLQDFLLSEAVQRIDVMVLSHPQADHIGDFANIARNFEVGLFVEGAEDHTSNAYVELVNVLDAKQIPRQKVKYGDSFLLDDDTACWVLNPLQNTDDFTGDINEQSVVLLMDSIGKRFLFTGDIGISTENKLCRMLEDWDIDVLKAPHHGSRYSSGENLLMETLPETAVIQVGRNNYGHPHPDARQRMYAVNAHVLRNDYDGTVRYQSFGDGYWINTSQSNMLFVHE